MSWIVPYRWSGGVFYFRFADQESADRFRKRMDIT